jgi:hypothetical protein
MQPARLSLWSRKPLEPNATSEFEAPLTWRFDETDAMVMFDDVKVPWERVFVHNDAQLSRGLYIETPAHAYGNHQSNVRYLVKLQFLVGLASRITQSTGADQVPQVRETLGRLASLEALLAGLVAGQIQACEEWPTPGYVTYNRRMMYAALNWGVENYSAIVDCVRELCGGGVFQMPADASVLDDPHTAEFFRTYWHTPQMDALSRMKLFSSPGTSWARVRRPASAVRKVLPRRAVRGPQPQFSRGPVGRVDRHGGRPARTHAAAPSSARPAGGGVAGDGGRSMRHARRALAADVQEGEGPRAQPDGRPSDGEEAPGARLREPYVGQALRRVEDDRLLRGAGRFVDDLAPERCLHLESCAAPTRPGSSPTS